MSDRNSPTEGGQIPVPRKKSNKSEKQTWTFELFVLLNESTVEAHIWTSSWVIIYTHYCLQYFMFTILALATKCIPLICWAPDSSCVKQARIAPLCLCWLVDNCKLFPPLEYPGQTTSKMSIITVCDVFHTERLFLTHLPLWDEDGNVNGDTCLLECLRWGT